MIKNLSSIPHRFATIPYAVQAPSVHLWRRFAAIFYDSLALGAVLFFATGLLLAALGGEAILPANPFFTLYLVVVSYVYFAFCWTRGGQTLGMRTWKIKLLDRDDDGYISLRQSIVRFCAAMMSWLFFGLGFFMALADKERRTWHDRLSGSRLVRVGGSDENRSGSASTLRQDGRLHRPDR